MFYLKLFGIAFIVLFILMRKDDDAFLSSILVAVFVVTGTAIVREGWILWFFLFLLSIGLVLGMFVVYKIHTEEEEEVRKRLEGYYLNVIQNWELKDGWLAVKKNGEIHYFSNRPSINPIKMDWNNIGVKVGFVDKIISKYWRGSARKIID